MDLKPSIFKAIKALSRMAPIIIGMVLLVGLINTVIPKSFFLAIFKGNLFLDSFIGSSVGSILAGNPITSYIIGGELLNTGISLIAVTAFIVSWVTVGIVQFPAEAMLLGKKFAVIRNVTAFFLAIFVGILTALVVSII